MSSALAVSSEESCTDSEVEALAEAAVYSANWDADGGGGGAGGPCMTPPSPSASATADIETIRRQVAKNCASFVIVLFVLFIERSLC